MNPSPDRMTPLEVRASASLASIFALRLLGLFLILPVFAVHARTIPGGNDRCWWESLDLRTTQGVLQIPFGAASDRWGRKPVMIAGLLLFAVGSSSPRLRPTCRTISARDTGTGAISAAVTAMIAD
jgi:MFS family permease